MKDKTFCLAVVFTINFESHILIELKSCVCIQCEMVAYAVHMCVVSYAISIVSFGDTVKFLKLCPLIQYWPYWVRLPVTVTDLTVCDL